VVRRPSKQSARQYDTLIIPEGLVTRNHCAGEDHLQFNSLGAST
jgi:hypothetical protein